MNIEILDLVMVNLEGLTDTLKNRSTVNNNNHKAKLTSHNYEDLGGVSKLAHNHEILPQLNLKETQLRYLSSVCFKVGNISRIASVRASMPPLLPVFVLFVLFFLFSPCPFLFGGICAVLILRKEDPTIFVSATGIGKHRITS